MPAIPETNAHLHVSTNETVSGDTDELTLEYNFFKEAFDIKLRIKINVVSGSFGIRLDFDVSNLAVANADEFIYDIPILDYSDGIHTVKFVALEDNSEFNLLEVVIRGGVAG